MIQLINVSIKFKNGTIGLQNINLRIDQGEFLYVVGVSGAGKSTFTKLLIHEYVPTQGTIIVNGKTVNKLSRRQVSKFRREIGFVFQDFRLLSDRTAYENVAFAGECIGLSPMKVRKRAIEALKFVGLSHREKHLPKELSGGEQQRVAIARAILNRPEIIIADEPTGNLDPDTAKDIMEIFESLNAMGKTIIMATHDQNLVNQYTHRVISMADGVLTSDTHEGRYQLTHARPTYL